MRSRILAAVVFLSAGAGFSYLFFSSARAGSPVPLPFFISPLLFIFAAAALFYRPRIGHGIGLAAGLLALGWLVWTELALSPWVNTWITLNVSYGPERSMVFLAELRILTTTLVLFAVFRAALSFLPARWSFRGRPISERVWPAAAVAVLALAAWFGWAVRPYRLPVIVDRGPIPTLRILHVEKRGLQFHETFASTSRDARFWISRDDRRLFQYQFQKDTREGVMPPGVEQDVTALVQSPQLQNVHAPPPKALRSWNAEGWYALTASSGISTFTTENNTQPPSDLVRVFRELEALKSGATEQDETRDVCLGFCYDPLAGLGLSAANDRCHYSPTGIKCR
ncbi:MAG: hypothetical protein WAN23_05530 [Candidatus Acidiferrales bacterium]